MFKINTKLAFRNLSKHKLYSFINISGLAIGIAACLVIFQYVLFQFSYDQYYTRSEDIYRVAITETQNGEDTGTGIYVGYALGPALQKDLPEIETFSRYHPEYGGSVMTALVDNTSEQPFFEEEIIYTDPSFLDMFDIKILIGDANGLKEPNNMYISESMAKKHFGSVENANGQRIKADGGWAADTYTVAGVFRDIPKNSHYKADFIKSIVKLLSVDQYQREGADWGWTNFSMYVQLSPEINKAAFDVKIKDLMHTYTPERLESRTTKAEIKLEQVTDIHLSSIVDNQDGDYAQRQNKSNVYFLIIIAIFILVIAWINFINLSTAKATERSQEVGVKKAMGALKPQLVWQFLTESFWINFLAVAIGVGLAILITPVLGEVIGERLTLDFGNSTTWLSILTLILAGPILAGIYPALAMSSFNVLFALRGGKQKVLNSRFSVREGLVVFQFIISTLLISGTLAVSKQLNFMENGNTGVDMSEMLIIKGPSVGVTLEKFNAFKDAMSSYGYVESLTTSRSIPGNGYNWGTGARNIVADQSAEQPIEITWIDDNFVDTYELELLAGLDFKNMPEEGPTQAIINEQSLKAYNLGSASEAVNQRMIISGDTVIIRGIVRDHNWQSLHKAVMPSAYYHIPATVRFFSLKINPSNAQDVIKKAEEEFANIFPGNPMDFFFLDDFFNRQYEQDRQFRVIFNAFTVFAMIAACLGLFGLASYSIIQKAKEIGIRKVLGASSASISYAFTRKYLVLVLIANILAIPLSYFAIHNWLEDFAFSINIGADLFVLPVFLLIFIAVATVSFQTLKASMANPVNNLKSE